MGEPFQQPSRRRVHRYLVFRFAIILMALGLVTVYQTGLEYAQREPAFWFLYKVLGFYAMAGLLSLLAVRRFKTDRVFVGIQVGLDFVMGALITGVTGGVVRVFCPLLFVSLFSACSVVSWRGAVIFAALATTFLAVMTLGHALEYFQLSSNRQRWLFDKQQVRTIATYLVAIGVAFHIVAILGSRLTAGLVRIQSLQTEILDNMAEGLVAVDTDNNILEINSEARKLLELTANANPIGCKIQNILRSDNLIQMLAERGACGRSRCEDRVVLPSGDRRHVEMKLSSIPDERGLSRGWILLINDLSLKKEVEEAERRIEQLEHLYQMGLGIAHEIRNPLACIRGCMQEIGGLGEMNPACRPLVEIVCRESDRLDGIIEDFMSYTRGGARPTAVTNLSEILDGSVTLIQNHPEIAERTVVWNGAPDALRILGDRERLQQVFLNLGLNALDSTSGSGGVIEFSVRRRYQAVGADASLRGEARVPGIVVEVKDNGTGIAPDDLEKIFTPFFTKKDKGVGLGLAIVHRIVQEHLGSVHAESEIGAGTKFVLWFPEEIERALGKSELHRAALSSTSELATVERDLS